ncbi:hypothetical protein [Kistimonas scapharcae]
MHAALISGILAGVMGNGSVLAQSIPDAFAPPPTGKYVQDGFS